MIPCGNRPDKKLNTKGEMRLEMVKRAIDDYFPRGYPVKVDDIEIQNGDSIPTYFLMKQLENQHANSKFYFMCGSDLIPGLIEWDEGQKMIDEINYIVFERKGFESNLDGDYQMPKNMEILKSNQNLIGMISSTEVRRRIQSAKAEAQAQINSEEDMNEEETIKSTNAVQSASYFYQIGGLVTKSTIEYIRENNLY